MRKSGSLIITLLLILMVTAVSSESAVVCGTVVDTVMVTEREGGNPYFVVRPVVGCTVSVSITCMEESRDEYFAVTDAYGYYHVNITEPQCASGRPYYIQVQGKSTNVPLSGSMSYSSSEIVDGRYTINLNRVYNYSGSSTVLSGYKYGISFLKNSAFVHEGNYLSGDSYLVGLAGTHDTLHFLDGAVYRYQLLTSGGLLVFDSIVFFNSLGQTVNVYLDESYYQPRQHVIKIPENLEENYPDFAADRKLSLIVSLISTTIADTITFQVSNDDIGFGATGVVRKITADNKTAVNVSDGKNLTVSFEKPGSYTVGLYSVNGRLLRTIVNNSWFNSGTYSFSTGSVFSDANGIVIAKVSGAQNTTASVLKKIH